MPKDKFNPIAQLPILPGTEIASDEKQTNIIDSTYPPIDTPTGEIKKPQIEIRIKPSEVEDPMDQTKEGKRLTAVRLTILISLIVLVFAGILLTFQLVPKLMSSFSGANQPLGMLITSTSTNQQVPATIPLVVAPTLSIPTAAVTVSPMKPAITTSPVIAPIAIATQPKTPAKIIANLISTDIVGNQALVKFNVQNIGGTTSGSWSFAVNLPSNITPKYYSQTQSPLTPGSGVINTLAFSADQYLELPALVAIYQ